MPKFTVTDDTRSPRDRATAEALDRFDRMAKIVAAGRLAYLADQLAEYDERVAAHRERKARQEQAQADAVVALRARLLAN